MPDKPTYHYECAKEVGMLPSLDAAKSEAERLHREIRSDTEILEKTKTGGTTQHEAALRLRSLQQKVRCLESMRMIVVRRRKELSEQNEGA